MTNRDRRSRVRRKRFISVAFAVCAMTAVRTGAQELEPRSYSPAPIGTTFVIGGFGRSQGPVLLDPSLDVDHVEGDLWVGTPGFGRVFGLAGRQARLLVVAPIAWGAIEGAVSGKPARQQLAGLVDPRIKFSVGVHGAPALRPSEFARAPRAATMVGGSVTVVPPWGQYTAAQLVNLGFNRWAIKPEIGLSRQIDRWTIEGYAGMWVFTANDAYYPGHARKEQEPVLAAQAHGSYALPRRSWIALDSTWFVGGQTRVDGLANPDEQRNIRLGAVYAFPLPGGQSLKIVYSTGASTRRGSAFHTFNVTWQLVKIQ